MVIEQLTAAPIVPILRKVPYEKSASIVQALIDGGVTSIEVTMESDRAEEIIAESIQSHGSKVLVGAGTVLNVNDCRRAIEAGAQFIVTPALDEEVTAYAVEQNIPIIPGVFTPAEMMRAMKLGAEAIKLFPASVLGPAFIKDVKGPLGHIPIMTTGGITLETAADYIKAGAAAVGTGSALLKGDLIAASDWEGLKKETEKWLQAVTSQKVMG
ncbi:bifunctional 4-hydroxy-2-oxoglutarate aldolase/2-dehydro-3-deoxy-phosphogluconate aldolase [Domibacillus robiginosus]|uniref:bifunctional 4-hydroxy-2-oxoglutarate aldolase/2-dehydro-3-deoxy-phosphogluconate aldolase n=1 Tax=Domibacillus robiginosus TaxID=1071054 RepID=UPI00067B0A9D|nr:bifunctional 4-hydroxy-2-oxoglutarate aldolase/2-dehydro-3-deoxy-phosphogluconate aldolase [Domibacillus robiginosus]